MREKLKKILVYIFRSWDKEPRYINWRLKILPPFLYELLAYLFILSILYQIGAYLYNLI